MSIAISKHDQCYRLQVINELILYRNIHTLSDVTLPPLAFSSISPLSPAHERNHIPEIIQSYIPQRYVMKCTVKYSEILPSWKTVAKFS